MFCKINDGVSIVYHRLIERKIRALLDAVNSGDIEPVIAGFSRKFEHAYLGEHAIGGARHTVEATRRWYERLFRLLPDIRFTVEKITVRGMPWSTIAIVEWRESNFGADGVETSARGVHIASIRWGKITRLLILSETHLLMKTLERLSANGFPEADAKPIVS